MGKAATLFIITTAALAGGCTFGLGDRVSFATRNASLTGELADGAFASGEATVTVVPAEMELERGVVIFLTGTDGARTLDTMLELEGNLGALCPGSHVELAGSGGRLPAVSQGGAPLPMLDELSRLHLTMRSSVSGEPEELRPQRVRISAQPGSGGFSVMTFASTSTVDGEERTISGTFELARIVEDAPVPGWEGDTWEGQPIAAWD